MLLVVDANIAISMLISKGLKHKMFFSENVEANSPDRILFEIGKFPIILNIAIPLSIL